MAGFFIAIEGIDGTGKSTQTNILVQKLRSAGIDCVQTFEPGDNSIGASLRNLIFSGNADPITEAYLFCADRAMHVKEIVRPALDAGKCVVSDRFVLSSIAYQGYGKSLDPDWIKQINERAINSTMPNLTIVLDSPVKTGLGRAKCDNHFENEPLLEKVREGFLLEVKRNPDIMEIVDATDDINSIANQIFIMVAKKMEV